jgi:type VI secretion system secreted protein VgrG
MATIGFTQTDRALQIETPLGPDVLLLRSVSGQEAISQLFRFQLELLSETDDSIAFDSIVGQNVTIHLQTQDSYRDFNGFISRFSQGSSDGRFTYYRAEMVPWLWFLTRKSDCRIFQQQSVPDIIQTIFKELSFSDFELRLYGPFRKRDYCVQYRETDFNFVSRLMEEEGIYYFFEHHTDGSDSQVAAGKHVLVLANDPAGQKPCPGQPKARCDFAMGGGRLDDLITDWRIEEEYRPSAWAHTDYNFETPSTDLMATVQDEGTYEIYDYPGIYAKKSDGTQLAKTRLQETLAFKKRVSGKSNCRYFTTGSTVEVTDHYRNDMNQKWMLTAVYHQCSMGEAYGSGGNDEGFFYSNTFECIPADVPFRPMRVTPKPSVQGCQTALVVGPGGEEIYTDKYGRVKVQFHWDRKGKKNESSSCWVRVSYPWAGKSWGGIHIPRIGQEVIVDFLEGDPDQPIIVGRVYNAEQMAPWGLPGKAVISGLKSNSTKGGGGYNEISMDDTKGTELINIHAQYDQHKKIEHDEVVSVGHDRTEEVGHDEAIKIDNDKAEIVVHDRSLEVGHDKSEKVGRNKTVHIGAVHNETIDGSMYVTVGSSLTEMVAVNYAETVGAAMELTVGGALAVSVGAAMAVTVGGAKTESVGLLRSVNVGQNNTLNVGKDLTERVAHDRMVEITNDLKETIGGQHQETVTKEYTLHAKKIDIVADEEINIKTGSAEIVMKKSGDITINGGKITLKGSGDVVIKGSSIKEN